MVVESSSWPHCAFAMHLECWVTVKECRQGFVCRCLSADGKSIGREGAGSCRDLEYGASGAIGAIGAIVSCSSSGKADGAMGAPYSPRCEMLGSSSTTVSFVGLDVASFRRLLR